MSSSFINQGSVPPRTAIIICCLPLTMAPRKHVQQQKPEEQYATCHVIQIGSWRIQVKPANNNYLVGSSLINKVISISLRDFDGELEIEEMKMAQEESTGTVMDVKRSNSKLAKISEESYGHAPASTPTRARRGRPKASDPSKTLPKQGRKSRLGSLREYPARSRVATSELPLVSTHEVSRKSSSKKQYVPSTALNERYRDHSATQISSLIEEVSDIMASGFLEDDAITALAGFPDLLKKQERSNSYAANAQSLKQARIPKKNLKRSSDSLDELPSADQVKKKRGRPSKKDKIQSGTFPELSESQKVDKVHGLTNKMLVETTYVPVEPKHSKPVNLDEVQAAEDRKVDKVHGVSDKMLGETISVPVEPKHSEAVNLDEVQAAQESEVPIGTNRIGHPKVDEPNTTKVNIFSIETISVPVGPIRSEPQKMDEVKAAIVDEIQNESIAVLVGLPQNGDELQATSENRRILQCQGRSSLVNIPNEIEHLWTAKALTSQTGDSNTQTPVEGYHLTSLDIANTGSSGPPKAIAFDLIPPRTLDLETKYVDKHTDIAPIAVKRGRGRPKRSDPSQIVDRAAGPESPEGW